MTKGTPKGAGLAWARWALTVETDECFFTPYFSVTISPGRRVEMHVAICILAHGERPQDKSEVAHSCGRGPKSVTDRKGCANKRHVRWSDHTENMQDTFVHGTHNRGERSARARLSADQVRLILHRLAEGEQASAIAASYGLSKGAIRDIKNGRNWRHIERP